MAADARQELDRRVRDRHGGARDGLGQGALSVSQGQVDQAADVCDVAVEVAGEDAGPSRRVGLDQQ